MNNSESGVVIQNRGDESIAFGMGLALLLGSEVVTLATFRFGIAFRFRSLMSISVQPTDFEVVILNHGCDTGERACRFDSESPFQSLSDSESCPGFLRELPANPEIKFRWRFHGETVAIRKRFWLGFRPLFLNSGHIPIQNRLQLTSGV